MKVLVQRVKEAQLFIRDNITYIDKGAIKQGLLIYVGFEKGDSPESLRRCVSKTVNLRIFEDDKGKMMYSVKDKGYNIMCIPNFTLSGSLKKGNRPSFDNSASKDAAEKMFNCFCEEIDKDNINCVRGIFGAMMIIKSDSWGPVNIVLDSKEHSA